VEVGSVCTFLCVTMTMYIFSGCYNNINNTVIIRGGRESEKGVPLFFASQQ